MTTPKRLPPPEGYDPNQKYATRTVPESFNFLGWLRKKYGPDATNADLTTAELAYAKERWRFDFDLTRLPQSHKRDSRGAWTPIWSDAQRHRMAQAAYDQAVERGKPHPFIAAVHWAQEYDYWQENGVALSFDKDAYLAWRAGTGPKPWE